MSNLTVPEYNKIFYPAWNKARSFVECFEHALQKSDDNARKQMECIGWDEETKQFLIDAVYMMKDAAKTSYSWNQREWWKEQVDGEKDI